MPNFETTTSKSSMSHFQGTFLGTFLGTISGTISGTILWTIRDILETPQPTWPYFFYILASITAVETTASTSSLDVDLPSTTSQRRTWRLKPSVRYSTIFFRIFFFTVSDLFYLKELDTVFVTKSLPRTRTVFLL